MDLTLSILATVLLVASTVTVVGNAAGTKGFTMKMPGGPDAMGVVVFFIFNLLGWILTLIASWFVAGRGGFVWFVNPPAMAGLFLTFIAVALAFLSVMGLGVSLERKTSVRWLPGWAAAGVLPIWTNSLLAYLAWGDPEALRTSMTPRIVGVPLAVLAVCSFGLGAVLWIIHQGKVAQRLARSDQQRREQEDRNRVEAAERDVRHKAELDALPDSAPLTTFVTHLFIDKSDAHHPLAMARIASLPDLAARFDEELKHPDPLQREYLLNYFRVADPLDPALLEALRPAISRCFGHLTSDLAAARTGDTAGEVRHPYGMPLGLLLSAQRFPGPRFEAEARALRAELVAWETDPTTRAVERVDEYLAGQPVNK